MKTEDANRERVVTVKNGWLLLPITSSPNPQSALDTRGGVEHPVAHEDSHHSASPSRFQRGPGAGRAGEEVTVLNRTRPVARICPPRPEAPAKFKMPDFAARAKALFGDSDD